MPNNKSTRPFANLTAEQKLAAIFSFEPLRDIDPAILSPVVPDGRRYVYPPLLQFIVAMSARLFASQNKALSEMRRPGVWDQCCKQYASLVGMPVNLPTAPPTAREQDAFVERFTEDSHNLERLAEELTELAVCQAIQQGHFPDGVLPDFANPDPRHLIFGDGTWQSAYSSVTEFFDKDGTLIGYRGSRAKHKPRVQRLRLRGTIDGKQVDGINNLFLGTWTDDGRIILACKPTVASEGKAAVEMIDALAKRLGTRLHTVVYDRAVTGWWIQDLMARHGVLVMTKPVARGRSSRADGYTARDISEERARDLHRASQPLPLGTTVYLSADKAHQSTIKQGDDGKRQIRADPLKSIRSTYHRLTPMPRDIAHCTVDHDLWVDAGMLVDVVLDTNTQRLFKRATARAVCAETQPAKTLLTKELRIAWKLPCTAADHGQHHFETVWQPQSGVSQRPARGAQRALQDLRPLGVNDNQFWKAHGKRNNAESHNSGYKDTFWHDGRAMRLKADAQFLDQLACAAVFNALTWWRFIQRERLELETKNNHGRTSS